MADAVEVGHGEADRSRDYATVVVATTDVEAIAAGFATAASQRAIVVSR